MKISKLIFLIFLFSSNAFSQKDIDLKLLNVYTDSTVLISDTLYSQMAISIPFVYYISFTNQGENAIDENDTILLHYYINGQKQFFDITVYPPTDSVPYTNINLAPNDTMLLKIVVFNNYGFYATENNGKMEECFELIPSDNSSTLNELSPEDNILCYNRTVISNALSTENELNFSKFRVYPNPSSEILKFNYPLKDFKIYDTYGRKVNNYSIIDKFRVDISKIPKGNYFIIGRFKQHLLKRIIIIQ